MPCGGGQTAFPRMRIGRIRLVYAQDMEVRQAQRAFQRQRLPEQRLQDIRDVHGALFSDPGSLWAELLRPKPYDD